MDKIPSMTPEQHAIVEGVAKCFLPNILWEDAPTSVKNRCKDRAKEVLTYLDSQGVKLPGGKRLIRG